MARKGKKAAQQDSVLGSSKLTPRPYEKDQEELALEETVFGGSFRAFQDDRAGLKDDELHSIQSDDEETGLERLEDSNVRPIHSRDTLLPA